MNRGNLPTADNMPLDPVGIMVADMGQVIILNFQYPSGIIA
jgi:hypothetical protein